VDLVDQLHLVDLEVQQYLEDLADLVDLLRPVVLEDLVDQLRLEVLADLAVLEDQ